MQAVDEAQTGIQNVVPAEESPRPRIRADQACERTGYVVVRSVLVGVFGAVVCVVRFLFGAGRAVKDVAQPALTRALEGVEAWDPTQPSRPVPPPSNPHG